MAVNNQLLTPSCSQASLDEAIEASCGILGLGSGTLDPHPPTQPLLITAQVARHCLGGAPLAPSAGGNMKCAYLCRFHFLRSPLLRIFHEFRYMQPLSPRRRSWGVSASRHLSRTPTIAIGSSGQGSMTGNSKQYDIQGGNRTVNKLCAD